MPEMDPITRAILQLARWGLEREARETGNVDELAGTATSPAGDGSEEAADVIVSCEAHTASATDSIDTDSSRAERSRGPD